MNLEYIKKEISIYKEKLINKGFVPEKAPNNKANNTARVDMNHCLWMISKIEIFIDNNDLESAFKWFGFVQGCLWCCGLFTTEQMKDYNS